MPVKWQQPPSAGRRCKQYDERIAHLALARIASDLDDGVKVNYEKVQTVDGVKYPVLAKI